MNYNYVYLDPRKECKIKIILGEFELILNHEPIYVGVGKNKRYEHHIDEALLSIDKEDVTKQIKINTIKKILKTTNLNREEYLNKYVLIFNNNEDRNKCLVTEKYLVELLGTRQPVYGVLNRGFLTNQLRGGLANPILIAEQNGFYKKKHKKESLIKIQKSQQWFYDKWGSAYNMIKETDFERYNSIVLKLKNKRIEFLSTKTKYELSEYSKKAIITKNTRDLLNPERVTERNFRSNEKRQITLLKRTDEQKKYLSERYKQGMYNYKISSPEKWEQRNKTISQKTKGWWKSLSEEKRSNYLSNREKSLDKYWDEFYSNDIIREERRNKNGFVSRKQELTEEEYKEYCKERRGGEKNPNFGQGHKQSGSNNGRAKIYLIVDGTNQFICYGNFGKFFNDYKNKWLKQNPKYKNFKREIFDNNSSEEFKKKFGYVSVEELTKEQYNEIKDKIKLYE